MGEALVTPDLPIDAESGKRPDIRSILAQRAGWNLTDQLLSSLSNFVLSVLVARRLGAGAYGAFALSFSIYAYAVTVSRLLVSQPLMIRYSGASRQEFERAARQSTGAALVTAGMAGCALLLVSVAVAGDLGTSLAVTGVLLPGLLLQDAFRMAFFAVGRPAAAAANDGFWATAQVAAILGVDQFWVGSAVSYLWAWGISGCLAALLGVLQMRLCPAPRDVRRWIQAHSDLTRYSVTEVILINGANQLTLVLAAAIGGLTVVGALRGAQVMTAPTTILSLSTIAFVVPELARRPSIMGRQLIKAGLAVSIVVTALVAIWGTLLLLLPYSIGAWALGDTWDGTHAILLPTVIGMLAGIASLGASGGVYARGGMRVLFPLVLLGAAVYVVAGLIGVLLAGAYGTAVGLAVAATYGSVLSWTRFTMIARPTQQRKRRKRP